MNSFPPSSSDLRYQSFRSNACSLLKAILLFSVLALVARDMFAAPPADPAGGRRQAVDPQPGWLDQAERDLREREYEISWQTTPAVEGLAASWHAPNRAHGFRTYFTPEGLRVVPRIDEGPRWVWGLELIGYGRAGESWAVPAANLSPSGKRIDYHRGALTEWYENDARGLKQGFVLPLPPDDAARQWRSAPLSVVGAGPGRGRDLDPRDLVHVDLALQGDLSPVIATDGQAIDFIIPGGAAVLRYAELLVTDAGGEVLPAWMEGFVGAGVRGIRLVVNARGAAYPLTIDPLATSPAWTAEGDQISAEFGYSVATAGDVNGDGFADVIVGAYLYDNGEVDEGRAFLYLGSASGLSPSAVWSAEVDQASAHFGLSVATAGDINGDGFADVIVGAYAYDNGEVDEGKVFVYLGSTSGLALMPAWTAESDQASALFGIRVATAGDVNGDGFADVIVGASAYDNGEINEGRAFVYLGSASGLSTTPAWTAESDQASARFGAAVAPAGDVNGDGFADVIVEAIHYDNGETDEGRTYVYHGSASGLSSIPDWTWESNQANSQWEGAVATAGDVNGDGFADVIVGLPLFGNGEPSEGRAVLFFGSASGLSSSPDWTMELNLVDVWFGFSVAAAGDINGDGFSDVIIGAIFYRNGQFDEGAAFLFQGSASGPSSSPDWIGESNQADAWFGWSVATAGDVNGDGFADVLVGAPRYDDGEADEGRAYVYYGSPTGPSTTSGWTAEVDQASAHAGNSAATAGDVNGDGYADVIVGVHDYDNGESNEGGAFLYLGSDAGLSTLPDWMAEGNQTSAEFGISVGTAGDVNGDGYADLIVGSHRYDNGETNEGRAFVYHGSPAGLSPTASWTAEIDQVGADFGVSVGTAGDVNGDGYADVIIGARNFDNGQGNEGGAFVYLGSAAGLLPSYDWSAESNQVSALFGQSVSTAGDVNGDGYDDVIVGAYLYDNGQTDEGRAWVYLGSASGLSTSSAWVAESNQQTGLFGFSVASAGDVDGDGYADVIVGAWGFDNVQTNEGRGYVFLGTETGVSFSPAWTVFGNQAFANFGYAVAGAGDVNGDGFADVIVGATEYNNGELDEGRAFVYLGSASGLSTSAAWTAEADQVSANFGSSVAGAGDVNGDGYADLLVGANLYDNGETDEGAAFLYYGNGGAGVSVRPQQRRADDSSPIAPGGRSHSPGAFRIASLARSPFGRGGIGLEWEVKPLGTPFDGAGTQKSGSLTDSGTAGAGLSELASGLEPGRYHWRARLLYDPATTPFQSASRWFTAPLNGREERDLTLSTFLGGQVWEDRDGDGLRGGVEPDLGGVIVVLNAAGGTAIDQTVTSGDGSYRFELPAPGSYQLEFVVPGGYVLTAQDQGADDTIDSDADPVTAQTAYVGPLFTSIDEVRWSAGLRQVGPCIPPDETIFIAGVRTIPGTSDVVIDFLDPNQPGEITGYNVYRSADPGLDPALWVRLADDIVDADLATPNNQWVDDTGDVPPMGGAFYYDIAAYNHTCDAEGPR